MEVLRAIGSIDEGGILAFPGFGRFSREPPVLAAGVMAIRYSLERE
jgi:hypothetical protein